MHRQLLGLAPASSLTILSAKPDLEGRRRVIACSRLTWCRRSTMRKQPKPAPSSRLATLWASLRMPRAPPLPPSFSCVPHSAEKVRGQQQQQCPPQQLQGLHQQRNARCTRTHRALWFIALLGCMESVHSQLPPPSLQPPSPPPPSPSAPPLLPSLPPSAGYPGAPPGEYPPPGG